MVGFPHALLLSVQSVDLMSGVAEFDSDMADITQSNLPESMLGGEEEGALLQGDMNGTSPKLGGLVSEEHDSISASTHLASSMGINPHTLQVQPQAGQDASPTVRLWL